MMKSNSKLEVRGWRQETGNWRQITILFLALTISCAPHREQKKREFTPLKYAQGFSIKDSLDCKWVEVNHPYQGAKSGYTYLLVPKGKNIPDHAKNIQGISVPINSVVCTSTTHIPLLDYLNETDKLIGFPTTDYICSKKMRERVEAGKVKDLGTDKGMNMEELFVLKPALVMGYAMSEDLGQLKKIKELGIPVVINAEYLEKHPLGRAEWIKFMALFFNKEKEADSVFNFIESEYLTTQSLAKKAESKPSVMSGVVYGDVWFMPGGKNYAAQLLNDAACNYLWSTTESNGFLEVSFESVFSKAKEADLWIGVGSYKSLKEMEAAEKRYALFKAFKNKNVFTYNFKLGAKGGNEFLELGYLRPDIILKDLVKIAHPELMPQHEIYFYQKLD
ncbi:MAG TPA: vitamin B12-transporter protein BtuF [Cytophagales bacterium]|jgi:iron complex transport system substrate-binding protein|nr:vitamin B12-transporter protein BtuF [Cytophagales bacterium]